MALRIELGHIWRHRGAHGLSALLRRLLLLLRLWLGYSIDGANRRQAGMVMSHVLGRRRIGCLPVRWRVVVLSHGRGGIIRVCVRRI